MVFGIIDDLCELLQPYVEDETDRTYLSWNLLYAFNQVQGELITKLADLGAEVIKRDTTISELEQEIDSLRRVISGFVTEYTDVMHLVEGQAVDAGHYDTKIKHEESV